MSLSSIACFVNECLSEEDIRKFRDESVCAKIRDAMKEFGRINKSEVDRKCGVTCKPIKPVLDLIIDTFNDSSSTINELLPALVDRLCDLELSIQCISQTVSCSTGRLLTSPLEFLSNWMSSYFGISVALATIIIIAILVILLLSFLGGFLYAVGL